MVNLSRSKFYPFLIFSFLFLSLPANAILLGFCFDGAVNLSQAKNHLQTVLARGETVSEQGDCIEVESSSNKQELYNKWLMNRFAVKRTYIGSHLQKNLIQSNSSRRSFSRGSDCKIKFEVIKSSDRTKNSANIGRKSGVSATKEINEQSKVMNMLIGKGLDALLRAGNDFLRVKCIYSSGANTKVSLFLDGQDDSISTALDLNQGRRTNIGSVIQDLKNKARTINSRNGIDISNTVGESQTQYYLSVQ